MSPADSKWSDLRQEWPDAFPRPERIQRQRKKGWRLPPNTVCVARPGKWGNPWRIGMHRCSGSGIDYRDEPVSDAATSVRFFREMLTRESRAYPPNGDIVRELRGKNLACWCSLDQPCHADVLIEIANRPL